MGPVFFSEFTAQRDWKRNGFLEARKGSFEAVIDGKITHHFSITCIVAMATCLLKEGCPGEFLVIMGAFAVSPWVALGAATGMILGAAYMLLLYRRVAFGQINRESLRGLADLSAREHAIFAPLIVLTLWMGLYPSSFTQFFTASVAQIVTQHQAALGVARLAGIAP